MDREARQATVHEIARVGHDLAAKPPPFMYYLKALKSFGLWKETEDKNKGFIFKWNFLEWRLLFICAHIHFANIVSQLETSPHCKYSYNILIDMAL